VTEDIFAERLERQRDQCAAMGSPLYAQMLSEAVREHRAQGPVFYFLTKVPERASMSAPALRLLGAAHYLALTGKADDLASHLPSCGGDGNAVLAWRAVSQLTVHQQAEMGQLFAHVPQTNEVGRSLPLLAGMCAVAQKTKLPLRLLEVGASAGLNSRVDRYGYVGDGWTWGDAASPLVLNQRITSGKPSLVDFEIAERIGCDRNPRDANNTEDQLRLLSFIWPDQTERFAHLKAAFSAATDAPMRIDKMDLFEWLVFVAKPKPGHATIVMHSVIVDHLEPDQRVRLRNLIVKIADSATDDAPFAWLRMEAGASDFETRVTLWPDGSELFVCKSDAHGQDITWYPRT
jgi:hypothetical protein